MQTVFPEYYPQFKCIHRHCRHNCCIGWEIDIDENTAASYRSLPGPFGQRLRRNIEFTYPPHFITDTQDRCPFLNARGLCDIILELGEDHLCDICDRHPRFFSELPGRVEIGLGLCCEAAGTLILGQQEPVRLVGEPATECDELILLRDKLIQTLQQRTLSLQDRFERVAEMLHFSLPPTAPAHWAELLLPLERLEEGWTRRLEQLRQTNTDIVAFADHMRHRQTEYEQLAVYFLYRHFALAEDLRQAIPRAAFALFAVRLLEAMGAVQFTLQGSFTFEDQVELARAFSAEIEYSDENLQLMLEAVDPIDTDDHL